MAINLFVYNENVKEVYYYQRACRHAPEMTSLTKKIIGPMNSFNEKRLYWIWASSLINTVLSFVPHDFYHTQDALTVMRTLPFYSGVISWSLYYARFFIHFSLLLKNTIKGPWLTPEDKKSCWWDLSVYERFKSEWSKRKFNLLNDSIWATGNLICFFWLVGRGALGHMGSVLTIALLAFDIAMSVWDYIEQERGHKKASESSWKYKKYELYTNMGYAVGLIIAFSLMTLPFLSLSIPALLALSVTGTVLCFALTFLRGLIQCAIDVDKELQPYKNARLVHSALVSLLTPAVILSSLLFLPLGPGLILLGCCAVLAMVSGLIITHQKQVNSYKLSSDTSCSFFAKSNRIEYNDNACDSNEYTAPVKC